MHQKGSIIKGFLFRAENFFNYASSLDDMTAADPGLLDYYGGVSLHEQSHGEAFLSFFQSRCRVEGLYLLDEPEAALSPSNQLELVKVLWKIAATGTQQFIISTHSPIILSYPGAQILNFDCIPIREIAYEETHSCRFYRGFMNDRSSYLGELAGSTRADEEDDDGPGKL